MIFEDKIFLCLNHLYSMQPLMAVSLRLSQLIGVSVAEIFKQTNKKENKKIYFNETKKTLQLSSVVFIFFFFLLSLTQILING